MVPNAAPTLTLTDRLVGQRPLGTARRFRRVATYALLITFALSFLATALLPRFAPGSSESVAMGLLYIGSFALWILAALVQLWCWVVPRRRASITFANERLGVQRGGRRWEVPVADIATGWMIRDTQGPEVELRLRNGNVLSTTVTDDAEAHAVLDAANVAPEERALAMPMGGAASNLVLAVGMLFPAICASSLAAVAVEKWLHLRSDALGFLIFTLTALCVSLSLRYLSPPTVKVGHDGVAVEGGLRAWFVPFEQIAAVFGRGQDLVLGLRGGGERVISARGTDPARREALRARIVAGVAGAQGPRDLPARLALLDRGARTVTEWRSALDALREARDDYRATSLTRDELIAALEDPRTDGERRVAAAYVLAAMDRAEAGARVRVVVENVAQEPVRVALQRAAEGELDEAAVNEVAAARVRVT